MNLGMYGTGTLELTASQYVSIMSCSWTFTPSPGCYVLVEFFAFYVRV